jgi:quercetin dioxygenase-like cupin family protein
MATIKSMIGLILFAIVSCVSCANQRSTNAEKTKMETTQNDGAIFPKGERAPADYFSGTVYLQMLAQKTESNDYSIGSVTFEPGARSNWHTHPVGQTLIVINGKGLYQEKGNPIRTINKGETIICDPDTEHWHGASPDSQMTHIAITNDRGAGGVIWLKPVTDAEYNAGGK